MTGPPITIRRHVTESGKRGWRWTCRLCRAAGMHHYDRWTDHVLARYGKSDPHPQQRCLVGAEQHLLRVKQLRIPRLRHVMVQLHYAPGDKVRRDADNLVASSKPAVDAIVGLVVEDDTPEFVAHLMPAIHKGAGERRLWLVVQATPRPETEETPQ